MGNVMAPPHMTQQQQQHMQQQVSQQQYMQVSKLAFLCFIVRFTCEHVCYDLTRYGSYRALFLNRFFIAITPTLVKFMWFCLFWISRWLEDFLTRSTMARNNRASNRFLISGKWCSV